MEANWRQVFVVDRNSVRRKILVSIPEWMKFCITPVKYVREIDFVENKGEKMTNKYKVIK